MSKPTCPCCEASETYSRSTDNINVLECRKCSSLYTREGSSIYLGESYQIVLPHFSRETSMEGARYFDLLTLGSKGIKRRHGWFDPSSKLLLQVG